MNSLMDITYKQLIDSFDTCQCTVFVVDTGMTCFCEKIYAIISIHKCSDKINIRFGNKTQVEGMANVYKRT